MAMAINLHVTPESVAPKTPEDLARDAEMAATETTRLSLDTKVRTAVARDGTLDQALGTADTPWTPGAALTLRGWKAMTLAQIKALNLGQTQELLSKLAPLMVDLAVTLKRDGKLTVQLYDAG